MINNNLFEGLEKDDLKRLIHSELHIDEFRSKMGDDADVVVISFKVDSKQPAGDLVGFIEKGYSWVLDADVSAGEMSDGEYIVFVELDRDENAPERIIELLKDLTNVTGIDLEDWRIRYYKDRTEIGADIDELTATIPLTPEAYEKIYGQEAIDDIKTAAGLPVTTKAPKNEMTEWLRNVAGIIR